MRAFKKRNRPRQLKGGVKWDFSFVLMDPAAKTGKRMTRNSNKSEYCFVSSLSQTMTIFVTPFSITFTPFSNPREREVSKEHNRVVQTKINKRENSF